MAESWTVRRERGSRFAVLLLVWIARRLGRRISGLILHPVVLYYLLAAPAARAASRDYLRRVLEREPSWRDCYRHMHCYARTALDRLYMFGAKAGTLRITRHGYEAITRNRQRGTGAILLVAHLGSFDSLRGTGGKQNKTQFRVLMDRATGAKANAAFAAINPAMRDSADQSIIDTSKFDVDRVLKVKQALDRGELVGLMADRYRPGERTTDCYFLGDLAPLPLSPWLLAGITQAPVLLAFGLYCGGGRYQLHFETFSDRLLLPRARREALAHEYAQAYAARLEYYARKAPYNWFNFYDFWHK